MRDNRTAVGAIFAIIFLVIAWISPIKAHSIKLFATADNETITGYGYFPGGGKYRRGKLTIYGPENVVLGQLMTDDSGAFSFTAQYRCDHIFTIETGDGHFAHYTVKAAELPDSLPPLQINKSTEPSKPTGGGSELQPPSPNDARTTPLLESHKDPKNITNAHLEEIIGTAVARQVRPLREQLERYEQKVRLHDIFGGIGYIFGITGVAFYVAGRKKFRQSA